VNAGDAYGRYELIRLLGRGAMGEVYLARDGASLGEVAVKIVYKGAEPEDQDVLNAERLGAELQKRLSGIDPCVVRVSRYGEILGDLFIEMEYIEGEDLSTVLARVPVNAGFAAHVGIELCGMLEHLLEFQTSIDGRQFAGVIHGDLKPTNIRLTPQNHVKVLDFGIAKALSRTHKQTTNLFASTAYCSPERLETQTMDASSDLWSVGVLMYQMLAGRLPFNEPSKERLERRIRSSAPPDPLPEACPAPLATIIFKMLACDPARRYPSAKQVKEDLIRFQKGEPIVAEPFAEAAATTTAATGPFDADATVRSAPEPADPPEEDRTIRTTPPRETPRAPALIRKVRNHAAAIVAATIGLFMLSAAAFGMYQVHVWREADQLKTGLETERITNLDDAWNQYQRLNARMHLPLTLWAARRELKRRLVAEADETILEYRNSDARTVVYERQWMWARDALARALQLDPGDDGVKGRLRLCEGHIDRIHAAGLRGRVRDRTLSAAIMKFQEAATLLKKSPDPYLGLARLYAYELNDTDQAEQALDRAAQYGHPRGKREMAQLADAYRRRGDRLLYESRNFEDAPDQERQCLEKARQAYIHAEDLYQQAGYFADSARNQVAAIQGQQRVEQRLSDLEGGTASR
jgi:eukaryotic-like serine/threonine-protein kinase